MPSETDLNLMDNRINIRDAIQVDFYIIIRSDKLKLTFLSCHYYIFLGPNTKKLWLHTHIF